MLRGVRPRRYGCAESNPQTTDPATWQRLCEAFTSDPDLWQVVQLALAEPAVYLERFRESQSDRGIDTVEAVSPWIALIDWLHEHDRLIELDRRDTSVDLAENLSLLPLLYDLDVAPIEVEQVHLGFAVPRANAILAPRFLTLLYLDIDSDSYPLALVSTEAAPRIGSWPRVSAKSRVRSTTATPPATPTPPPTPTPPNRSRMARTATAPR